MWAIANFNRRKLTSLGQDALPPRVAPLESSIELLDPPAKDLCFGFDYLHMLIEEIEKNFEVDKDFDANADPEATDDFYECKLKDENDDAVFNNKADDFKVEFPNEIKKLLSVMNKKVFEDIIKILESNIVQ